MNDSTMENSVREIFKKIAKQTLLIFFILPTQMNFAPPKNRGKCNYGHKCNINNIHTNKQKNAIVYRSIACALVYRHQTVSMLENMLSTDDVLYLIFPLQGIGSRYDIWQNNIVLVCNYQGVVVKAPRYSKILFRKKQTRFVQIHIIIVHKLQWRCQYPKSGFFSAPNAFLHFLPHLCVFQSGKFGS